MFTKIEDAREQTVRTAAVYEDENGNRYEVDFDTCAENPVEVRDNAELCVLGAPRVTAPVSRREHTHTHTHTYNHTQQGRMTC